MQQPGFCRRQCNVFMSMANVLLATFAAVALGALLAAAQPAASSADNGNVVQRFLTGNAASPSAYRARRRLEARNERFNTDGWVEACTELVPGSGLHYHVIAEGGSGLIRDRVLRQALESEREAWANGEIDRSTLALANYDFQTTGGTDGDLLIVTLKPRRKSRMLVDGLMFLRQPDGELVRVEGTLAKGPSFWTPRVDVVRRYERIAGVRVPVALEFVAHVRVVGRSSFRMSYRYLSIGGHVLDDDDDACGRVASGSGHVD